MPIRDRDDATQVASRFQRFFDAKAEQRPGILRELFTEILDFDRESSQLSLVQAQGRAGIELPDVAERIATLDGVEVLYVDLSSVDTATERVRKAEVLAVTTVVRDALREDMLLLFSNSSGDQLHWIHPKFNGASTPTLRRIVLERGIEQRTAIQQLSNIYWNHQDSGNILDAVDEAFNVDKVTKDFFREYKRIFEQAEALISGFSDPEDRKQFVQTLFNRLMFVYFLSRKGWLRYEGETDYLSTLWDAYADHATQDNFYNDRLTFLFFQGLNNPDSRDVRRGVDFLIGDVPFLNGGLFEETEIDRRGDITVPDQAIRPLMTDLFDKFNFTVMESTPFDIEVAVDPEMLGKVFEELVTGRHDSGAYYTPRPVVSFMCREALKGYLEGALTPVLSQGEREQTAAAVARFVDDHDASGISISQATAIQQALEAVTVVDPACGSGAYLVGMMQELVDLRVELYNQKLKQDARSLYELKLHIIERNLYGVDIDQFAVDIARLRLWLSLAIDYEGGQPEPLPNLDFKIVQGDSLLGPDPSETGQQGVLGYDGNEVARLVELESLFFNERDSAQKKSRKKAIEAAHYQLREHLGLMGTPKEAIEWRVDFARPFTQSGFDIVIGNPPYAQIKKGTYSKKEFPYSEGKDKGKQNLYKLFVERSYQLCKPGGIGTMIVASTLMCDQSSAGTRQLLLNCSRLRHIVEFPETAATPSLQVFASVTQATCIYQFSKGVFPSAPFAISIGNDSASIENPEITFIHPETIHALYPIWMCFPMIKPGSEGLLTKLAGSGHITQLSASVESIAQGDLNLTGHRDYFSSRHTDVRLLRGRDISRFLVDFRNVREYCDDAFRVEYVERNRRRSFLLCQQIHNSGSPRRLHFGLANNLAVDYLCGNSINKVLLNNDELGKAYLAILNSSLLDWVFRVTSSNNHVQGYELEQLPICHLTLSDRRRLESLVEQILDAKDADPEADTSDLEREIDRLVYDLYGLTEEEIAAVERRVGAGRG